MICSSDKLNTLNNLGSVNSLTKINTSNSLQQRFNYRAHQRNRNLDTNSEKERTNLFHNSGKWSTEEHLEFIKGCLLFGKNWNKVSII